MFPDACRPIWSLFLICPRFVLRIASSFHISMTSSPAVFGFGNPLLDIQLHTDSEFLKKYSLQHGGYTFQGKAQEGIYEELKSMPGVGFIAGGATLNSMRVCQALSNTPGTVFYTGCIGKDDFGEKMHQLCHTEGVTTKFAYSSTNPTGVCGVSIVKKERSLCTRLGAAQDFKLEHLKAQWPYLEKAKIAYVTGFVLSVCVEGMRQVGQHCSENQKIFCTSLSAAFFVETFKNEMMSIIPYADFLFGNEDEFAHFAKVHGWGEDMSLEDVAVRVAQLPKVNVSRSRVVVVTQGSQSTIVASQWSQNGLWKVTKYPVVPLHEDEIVDTNTAGDAFVGGFLFGLLKSQDRGVDLDLSMHYAHVAARHVVQRDGCSFDFTSEKCLHL